MLSATNSATHVSRQVAVRHDEPQKAQSASPLSGRVTLNINWRKVWAVTAVAGLVFLPVIVAALPPIASCTTAGLVLFSAKQACVSPYETAFELAKCKKITSYKPDEIFAAMPLTTDFDDLVDRGAYFMEHGDKTDNEVLRAGFYRAAVKSFEEARKSLPPNHECAKEVVECRDDALFAEVQSCVHAAQCAPVPEQKIVWITQGMLALGLSNNPVNYNLPGTSPNLNRTKPFAAILWEQLANTFAALDPQAPVPAQTIFDGLPNPDVPQSARHAEARCRFYTSFYGEQKSPKSTLLLRQAFDLFPSVAREAINQGNVYLQAEKANVALHLNLADSSYGAIALKEVFVVESMFGKLSKSEENEELKMAYDIKRASWLRLVPTLFRNMVAREFFESSDREAKNLVQAAWQKHGQKCYQVPEFTYVKNLVVKAATA